MGEGTATESFAGGRKKVKKSPEKRKRDEIVSLIQVRTLKSQKRGMLACKKGKRFGEGKLSQRSKRGEKGEGRGRRDLCSYSKV